MKQIRDVLPLRIIKTTIAFLVSLLLAPIFYCDPFFAGLGSFKSMRESLTLSLNALLEQLLANFIGFVFAIVYGYFFGINPFSVTFAVFCLFIIIKKANLFDTYLNAGFTLVAIMMLSINEADILSRGVERFISTALGLVIALIINALLFRPKKTQDLNQLLFKINEFVHIYITHGLEEYAFLEINQTLEELRDEKAILSAEKKVFISSKAKKEKIREKLLEIEISEAQASVVLELEKIDEQLRELMIPIFIRLNYIKQYCADDKDEIADIKKEIKRLYVEHTDDSNFFTHTQFLSDLNSYINIIRDI